MRAEALAGVVGITGLVLGLLAALPSAPAPGVGGLAPAPVLRSAAPAAALELGVSARRAILPAARDFDAEIARRGRLAPRLPPLRRGFLEATDLRRFALERLPSAQAGEGASQYFIYLALDQCRNYLRGDYEGASANLSRLLGDADLGGAERAAWQAEYERCRGFALGDWAALGEALGAERPGAEVEYASVWFERAAAAGYPPALVEQALRPSPIGAEERRALLREALPTAGPDAYWLLFAHSGTLQAGELGAAALAWLIVACGAGQDCGEQARWYRGLACIPDERSCHPGQTALEHYWNAATPSDRDAAWTQAIEIQAMLDSGQWDELPLPDLEALDYRRLWGPAGT
jgi:hypothetical protein